MKKRQHNLSKETYERSGTWGNVKQSCLFKIYFQQLYGKILQNQNLASERRAKLRIFFRKICMIDMQNEFFKQHRRSLESLFLRVLKICKKIKLFLKEALYYSKAIDRQACKNPVLLFLLVPLSFVSTAMSFDSSKKSTTKG